MEKDQRILFFMIWIAAAVVGGSTGFIMGWLPAAIAVALIYDD